MSAVVGQVGSIVRYPVKSMAGEQLRQADISWHGITGDRRWAFVRPNRPRDGFPWLTIRQRPDLARFRPRLVQPSTPDRSEVLVELTDGRTMEITDPRLAAELGATPMKLDRGTFDVAPLSIVSTGTLDEVAAATGTAPDPRRLRPNLVVEAPAFAEDDWVGRELVIGDAVVRVDRRDRRCMIVNYDPDTDARAPQVLRHIARTRDLTLGTYATVVRPGRVGVGDEVVVAASSIRSTGRSAPPR